MGIIQRNRRYDEGFTIVELLVVILIIGVLAAIVIPSFLGQKGKASDTTAKEVARAASQAAETYETEHSDSYAGVDVKALHELDVTIQTAVGGDNAYLSNAEEFESGAGYKVTAIAPGTEDTYTITRTANGEFKRTCKRETASSGGCKGGTW